MRWLGLLILSTLSLAASEIRVATLHPLLGDLVRQLGGEAVELVELVARGDDPHHFEPTPDQLRLAATTQLCLASGKGLESYADSLRSVLPPTTRWLEVGESLPSLHGSCDHPGHRHHHTIDPHWWHSVDLFRRAATVVTTALCELSPEQAPVFREREARYRRQLDQLDTWIRRQVARIPPAQRVLATAHAAFGYFCDDYGFTAIPLQGLNREQVPDAPSLARLIKQIRQSGVAAIFPEDASNPKTLQTLAKDLGIQVAPPLIADGSTAAGYEAMMRHNVSVIIAALAPTVAEPQP